MDLGFDYHSALTISPQEFQTINSIWNRCTIQPTIFQVLQEKSRIQTFSRDEEAIRQCCDASTAQAQNIDGLGCMIRSRIWWKDYSHQIIVTKMIYKWKLQGGFKLTDWNKDQSLDFSPRFEFQCLDSKKWSFIKSFKLTENYQFQTVQRRTDKSMLWFWLYT